MLQGWAAWLPEDAVFTGLTACQAWGLWLPRMPATTPIDVAVPAASSRPRQPGLIRTTRVAAPPPGWEWQGVKVARVEEALLSAARSVSTLDLVVAIDSALKAGHTSRADLEAYAGQRRAGTVGLRRALSFADARSESPYESLLRCFHLSIGVAVTPQVDLWDRQGRHLARADLLIDGTRTLQEYDGADHRRPDQYRRDRGRDAGLARAAYVRYGWVREDLIPSALDVLRAAETAVGWPHDPSRLRRWRGMLRLSGFGSRDWSETVRSGVDPGDL